MRMTTIEATALARFLCSRRPDWGFPGVLAVLERSTGDVDATALAAIHCAADPEAKTPAAMTNPIYWPARRDQLEAQRIARAEAAKSRRVRAEIEADRARFDPDVSHAAYLRARAALAAVTRATSPSHPKRSKRDPIINQTSSLDGCSCDARIDWPGVAAELEQIAAAADAISPPDEPADRLERGR